MARKNTNNSSTSIPQDQLTDMIRKKAYEFYEKRGKKSQRQRCGVSTDVRNKAVQGFWTMHVEAMNWSGMGVGEYAAALSRSPRSLRKWHDRFEDGEVEID